MVKTKMSPDLKAKWVEALRSGKYKQGKRALRQITDAEGECFCSLGVLCDVSEKGEWRPSEFDKNFFKFVSTHGDGHTEVESGGFVHGMLRRECGLDYGAETDVIEMNDWQERSFAEIADYIEANL